MPPITKSIFIFVNLDNCVITLNVCFANSRVGANITHCVPSEREILMSDDCKSCTIGIKYANVLPDPVSDLRNMFCHLRF